MREGEKHQCMAASHTPPTGDLAHNPGMCPDRESNHQPFGLQAGSQSTEPHQPGPVGAFLLKSGTKQHAHYPCSTINITLEILIKAVREGRKIICMKTEKDEVK